MSIYLGGGVPLGIVEGEWDWQRRIPGGGIFGPPRFPGLLGDSAPRGIFGRIDKALAPYGGMGNVGLALLANSGPSRTPRGTGEILGTSLLQARQMHENQQDNAMLRHLRQARIDDGRRENEEREAAGRALMVAGLRRPMGHTTPDDGELREHPLPRTPGIAEQYGIASQDLARQGYMGPSMGFAQAAHGLLPKSPMPTDDMREWQMAVAEGSFNGTFYDWMRKFRGQRGSNGFPTSYEEFLLEQQNPEYSAWRKENRPNYGFEPRISDSNYFSRQAAQAYGGFWDPLTGAMMGLNKEASAKAIELQSIASKIHRDAGGQLTQAEAFEQAFARLKNPGGAPTGGDGPRPSAAAIEHLKRNPHLKDKFRERYGYLPPGF